MIRHYCTLFDSKYLPQGLALYESLKRQSSERFWLHVLAMDTRTERTLVDLELDSVKVVPLDVFEYHQKTAHLRESRTWQEYCWTCASNFMEYLMPACGEITYLDADLFFFSDPASVFKEIGKRSIAITPHRLIPSKKHLEVNGRYNVGWVTFKNTEAGRACLRDWAAKVREKCSAAEGCGDQKYLDEWPAKYGAEVCELGIGANVAPWNLANWELEGSVDGLPLLAIDKNGFWNWTKVVCYHFHEYIHGERLTNYELRQEDKDLIYAPYIEAVNRANERIAGVQTERQWETA